MPQTDMNALFQMMMQQPIQQQMSQAAPQAIAPGQAQVAPQSMPAAVPQMQPNSLNPMMDQTGVPVDQQALQTSMWRDPKFWQSISAAMPDPTGIGGVGRAMLEYQQNQQKRAFETGIMNQLGTQGSMPASSLQPQQQVPQLPAYDFGAGLGSGQLQQLQMATPGGSPFQNPFLYNAHQYQALIPQIYSNQDLSSDEKAQMIGRVGQMMDQAIEMDRQAKIIQFADEENQRAWSADARAQQGEARAADTYKFEKENIRPFELRQKTADTIRAEVQARVAQATEQTDIAASKAQLDAALFNAQVASMEASKMRKLYETTNSWDTFAKATNAQYMADQAAAEYNAALTAHNQNVLRGEVENLPAKQEFEKLKMQYDLSAMQGKLDQLPSILEKDAAQTESDRLKALNDIANSASARQRALVENIAATAIATQEKRFAESNAEAQAQHLQNLAKPSVGQTKPEAHQVTMANAMALGALAAVDPNFKMSSYLSELDGSIKYPELSKYFNTNPQAAAIFAKAYNENMAALLENTTPARNVVTQQQEVEKGVEKLPAVYKDNPQAMVVIGQVDKLDGSTATIVQLPSGERARLEPGQSPEAKKLGTEKIKAAFNNSATADLRQLDIDPGRRHPADILKEAAKQTKEYSLKNLAESLEKRSNTVVAPSKALNGSLMLAPKKANWGGVELPQKIEIVKAPTKAQIAIGNAQLRNTIPKRSRLVVPSLPMGLAKFYTGAANIGIALTPDGEYKLVDTSNPWNVANMSSTGE